MPGGLFQGLKQSVEGGRGQHVSFVDDVDLVGCLARCEPDLVTEVSDVVDAAVARGVDLDQVEGVSLSYRNADVALVIGLAVLRRAAVGGHGEYSRGAGLAGAAGSAKEVGVGEPLERYGLSEGLADGLLTDQLVQPPRTPLSVEDLSQSPAPQPSGPPAWPSSRLRPRGPRGRSLAGAAIRGQGEWRALSSPGGPPREPAVPPGDMR